MVDVSVQKAIDLNGSGETIQDAVSEALDRARLSVEGITSFEVQRIAGVVGESSTTYQVEIKVWFTLRKSLRLTDSTVTRSRMPSRARFANDCICASRDPPNTV